MNIGLASFDREYAVAGKQVVKKLSSLIKKGDFILRSDCVSFEQEFAEYCNSTFCIGVASGTAALHLSLVALGIGPGDEVITSSLSFNATAQAIAYTGAKPIFVDIDPHTGLMDVNLVTSALTRKTRAIIPVHLYGMAVDIDPLVQLCRKKSLFLIEDCAQAHGTLYKNKQVGTFGDAGCFSFMPAKNLGAYGDAGAITTSSAKLNHALQMLRNHGREEKYVHTVLGYAERLDNIQAAVLRIKLKYLDRWNKKRQRIAKQYYKFLDSNKLQCIEVPSHSNCTYYGFHILVENRDELSAQLGKNGIETNVYYPLPLHLQPVFKPLGSSVKSLPKVEKFVSQVISLPIHPFLKSSEVEYVVEKVNKYAR